MKKKLVLAVAFAAVLTTGTVLASPVHPGGLGIGALWGGSVGGGGNFGFGNVALSLKLPTVPIFWGVTLNIHNDWMAVGVQGDYYFMGGYLVGDILGWYLGLGAFGNFGFGSNVSFVGFGGRVPIGLTFQPISLLEVFLTLAPQVGGRVWISGNYSGFQFPQGSFFNFELGLRLWL